MKSLDNILSSIERKAESKRAKLINRVKQGIEPVLFLISPMSYCNFSCIYCTSYGFDTRVDPKKNLPPQKIHKLIDMIIDFKKRYPHAKVAVSFHGYEPLQYSFKVFKEVDKKVFESGFHELNNPEYPPIRLGVQTNGYLLTKSKIKFFHERGWRLSFSLDGPEEVHDYARRTRKGRPTYRRVMKSVELYEEYYGRKPFIISVWTKKHLDIGAEGYYEWLKENEFKRADIHHPSIVPNNPNLDRVITSLDDIIRWFSDLYKIWSNDTSGIELYPFVSYIEALINGRAQGRACYMRNGCYRVIELSYDGNFRLCDRWSYDLKLNIDSVNKLEDVYESKEFVKLFMRPFVLKYFHEQCSTCEWFSVCMGGCAIESKYNSMENGNALFGVPVWNNTNYCSFHREMFSLIKRDLETKC